MLTAALIVLSALASLISLQVGGGDFRITMGIVVLMSGIIVFKSKHPLLLAGITGGVIVAVRIIMASLIAPVTADQGASFMLEVIFYLAYVLIYIAVVTKSTSPYPLPLVASLVLCDAGANTLELALRTIVTNTELVGATLITILIAAVIRSTIIVLLAWLGQTIFHKKSA